MLFFIAASKGNYFQWTAENNVDMRSAERGQIWENNLQQH